MSEDTFKTHYISKYGIAYSCNVHPERLQSDIQAINPDDYKRIRNNQTVYVITSALPHWFSVIYPKLKENKIRIFLVTGDSTVSAPLAIFNGNKVQFHHYMREGVIIHWFCQNCDYPECPQISPIPLGLDFHTLHRMPNWGEPKTPYSEQDRQLQALSNGLAWKERKDAVLLDAHLTANTNPTDRSAAYTMLGPRPFIELLPASLRRSEYWQRIGQHKYIVSPLGKGMDCHRTWEAMIMGAIPIIRKTTITSLFHNMPVLQVDSYDAINEPMLKNFETAFLENKEKNIYHLERLTLEYWISFIKTTVSSILESTDDILSSSPDNACIVGCARNLYSKRDYIMNSIEQFRNEMPGCEFVFVESDSTDGTREWLATLERDSSDIHIISAGNLAERIPQRTNRISHCRNMYLDYVRKRSNKFGLMIPFDLDSPIKLPSNYRAIINRFIKSDYSAIFANTPTYYDIWALRSKECPNDCWIDIAIAKHKGMSHIDAKQKYVKAHQRKIPKHGKWIGVNSAFNCLGIYKVSHLKNAYYWGMQVFMEKNMIELCEHVYFHEMMRRNGCSLAIAPDLYLDNSEIGSDHL